MGKRKQDTQIAIKNRKAEFLYYLHTSYTAGIVLTGTEIKSIRQGKVNLKESYVKVAQGQAVIHGMHISPYDHGNIFNVDPLRDRKLLLHKKEILKIEQKMKEKGLTVVPLSLYINEDGRAKLEIALARGKKLYDKRDDIAKKDAARRMQRERRR
jgi:SsrA-binding protein